MKKQLMIAAVCSTLTLAGCVAVPAYSEPYGYGYYGQPVYVAPPAVVVQPTFRYSYYGSRRHYYR
jgi:hypothetical protein